NDVKHSTKRPLNGEKKIEISQRLAAGTLSATTWRRQEVTKVMNLYDSEPPHLYKASTLRKAKQERQDINLQIKGSCVFSNLQTMKYSNHAGSIHGIGYDPFFIHYWSAEQIAVYLEHHDIIYVDATGSLVKKLKLPNGEQSSHIYPYQAVTNTTTYKMPIFQMLSTVQHVNAIKYWLNEFLRIGSIKKAGFPIPRSVVCDFDMALLNALAKAFGQCYNLKHYLTTCFTLILNENTIEKSKCFIRLDICHYMHSVSRWKCLSEINPKVKKFYMRAMALLTKQVDFSRFVELAKCIIILSLNEEIGSNIEENNSAAESARKLITDYIKGVEYVASNDNDDKRIQNEEIDIEIKNCNISLWSYNLFQECQKTVTESTAECDIANPYYAPYLGKRLKTFFSYFPLYTSVMIPIFGYGQINESSSAVESEMNDIKHVLLKNISRPMRADKFVTTHLKSFTGRSLLAMASRESSQSAEKN
ncbi:120.7 kDa protein in NOF-FB transposable element, partial [Harpegnathos saltator]